MLDQLGFYWELYWTAMLAALLAGLTCPLVGAFLLVRRTAFHGVALPQLAAAGVAFGYTVLPWWIGAIGLHGMDYETAIHSPHAVVNYLLAWAGVFVFGGLAVLAGLGQRKETEVGRVAALFALAAAATTLFAMRSPAGSEAIGSLLRGEILAIGRHELETLAVVYGTVLLLLSLFAKDFVLVSYDVETARVLKKPVDAFELLLLVLVGLTVSLGTLLVGPVVLFGLLVVPPLAARAAARSMASFLWLSSGLGVLGSGAGLALSLGADWPLGPSIVAASAVALPICWLIGRLRE